MKNLLLSILLFVPSIAAADVCRLYVNETFVSVLKKSIQYERKIGEWTAATGLSERKRALSGIEEEYRAFFKAEFPVHSNADLAADYGVLLETFIEKKSVASGNPVYGTKVTEISHHTAKIYSNRNIIETYTDTDADKIAAQIYAFFKDKDCGNR